MALTPWEQHQWFLIQQHINDMGGLADPAAEDRATIRWRYILSSLYVVIGVIAVVVGLGFESLVVLLGGLALGAIGLTHLRLTYLADEVAPQPDPSRFFE